MRKTLIGAVAAGAVLLTSGGVASASATQPSVTPGQLAACWAANRYGDLTSTARFVAMVQATPGAQPGLRRELRHWEQDVVSFGPRPSVHQDAKDDYAVEKSCVRVQGY